MSFYLKPYSIKEIENLIKRSINLFNEQKIGFFAVILKENKKLIGNCGITIQNIDGNDEYEIGYHINKYYWNNRFATESASAIRDYGFHTLRIKKLCSYMAKKHLASRKVAENIGMKLEKTFNNPNNKNLPTTIYSVLNPIH